MSYQNSGQLQPLFVIFNIAAIVLSPFIILAKLRRPAGSIPPISRFQRTTSKREHEKA